jgi:hypothetical protein
MKKVFSSQDPVTISHYKNILANQGVACVLKNYYLTGAAGKLPLNACWPELWVLDDNQHQQALAILDQYNTPITGNTWICPSCGENIEPQFALCWQCGQ